MAIERIEWDERRGGLLVTREEVIAPQSKNMNDAKVKLKGRLREIVRQVKTLKTEAEQIKAVLAKIEGQETTPAPDTPTRLPE
ncbi:MAG TPA: hypothetical protein DEF34_03425 [Desulfotomaculum sp.]|nr:MAG: hypothetical protein JL56_03035 [Desulfotomaculum sp. BICA1-6]HBX22679.1 hypothetical protein [Desulfotomaculum sp.]